jgi:hypothetical protein
MHSPAAHNPSDPLALVLQDSGTSPAMRAVFFPDAAYLQFDAQPAPGDTVQMAHQLSGLTVGESYVFYLQVCVPATGDGLSIALNGTIAWELAANGTRHGGWHYVRLDWVTDSENLQITITREVGEHTSTASPAPRWPAPSTSIRCTKESSY